MPLGPEELAKTGSPFTSLMVDDDGRGDAIEIAFCFRFAAEPRAGAKNFDEEFLQQVSCEGGVPDLLADVKEQPGSESRIQVLEGGFGEFAFESCTRGWISLDQGGRFLLGGLSGRFRSSNETKLGAEEVVQQGSDQ